jgi:hypothetical protein
MDDNYVSFGRTTHFVPIQTMMTTLEEKYILPSLIELFTSLILGLMRLTYMELLSCMVALNFSNSFASFNANKVCRIAEFYPNDFSASDLIRLKI